MPDGASGSTTGYLNALYSLRVDRSSGEPALHQPIVLLWAMGNAFQRKPRLTSWRDSERTLRKLLQRHGRPNSTPDPQYPFVALHRSDVWKLEGAYGEIPQARGSALRSWLNDQNPQGGLESNLYDLLADDESFREQAVSVLMQQYFPEAKWEEILLDVDLQEKRFDGFGHPPYVPVGTTFSSRKALAAASVHNPPQGGIWGKQKEDAKSIVVSGGYPDDEDYNDEIIYTGQGGQTEGRHTHDQKLTLGNSALFNSMTSGQPVRVIRGAGKHSTFAPDSGLRYDGLYRVEECWSQVGVANFIVWRYRLRAIEETRDTFTPSPFVSPETLKTPPSGNANPGRRNVQIQRTIRSTEIANWVKDLHRHTCQICNLRIQTPTAAYAEAAHIKPLGRPHNGPDAADNVLCLCPNHHVAFDFGMLTINSDLTVLDRATGTESTLRTHPEHEINEEYLSYHRDHHARQDD